MRTRTIALALSLFPTLAAAQGSDDCVNAMPITGLGPFTFDVSTATQNGYYGGCGPLLDHWFAWTPPATGNYLMTGSVNSQFGAIGLNLLNGDSCILSTTLDCTNTSSYVLSVGLTYLVRVGVQSGGGSTGQFEFTPVVRPVNDECTGALPLSGLGTFNLNALGATSSAPGPWCSSSSGGDVDAWYRWTSGTTAGRYLLDPLEGGVRMALYDACFGTALACKSPGQAYMIADDLDPLTEYVLRISDSTVLSITTPISNDECQGALPISGTGVFPMVLDNATPSEGCTQGADVWFEWSAPETGAYRISIETVGATSGGAVYTSCPPGVPLVCEVYDCGDLIFAPCLLDFDATAGTNYFISLSSFADTPTFEFELLDGPQGTSFCPSTTNSSGLPAELTASGSSKVSTENLELQCSAVPPGVIGLFVAGSSMVSTPFGDGVLCAGGSQVFRLSYHQANAAGVMTQANLFDVPNASLLTPGSEWHFQTIFRDLAAGGAGFNLSSGLTILLEP